MREDAFEKSFKIKTQEYVILTFTKESAPSLREAIAISEKRDEKMLTVEEAMGHLANHESRAVLSNALDSDQRIVWSYLYTTRFGHIAASIGNDWSSRELRIAEHTDTGIYPSPILLLKRAKHEEAPQFSDFRNVVLSKLKRL